MIGALFRRVRSLGKDTGGNVAIIAGLTFMVMIVLGGGAVDLQRFYAARSQAQDAIDLAAIAAASTRETSVAGLRQAAEDWLDANAEINAIEGEPTVDVQIADISRIDMRLSGDVRTFFMGLIGIETLPIDVSTAVERGAVDRVELALVLDNTWSMDMRDAAGVRKIDALKAAARGLVDALMTREDGSVKVGVVPYADYVNVGLSRRGEDWLDVAPDSTRHWTENTPPRERTCRTVVPQKCTKGSPKTCTRAGKDGVPENYDCTPQTCTAQPEKSYESCTAAQPAKSTPKSSTTRWLGCVGSRRQGTSRLNDSGSQKYPGIMVSNTTTPNCLTEITTLTDRKSTVTSALTAMIINRGTQYQPSTYIPGGAIWGVNMLSPTAPLSEAAPYQENGRNPRKIMVLMTDGANTMRFNTNGTHTGNSAPQVATDNDTAEICTYAKSKGIEVYTVALAVDSNAARTLLENCASGSDHYYDARDSRTLAQAFADIAASIYRVRLVE